MDFCIQKLSNYTNLITKGTTPSNVGEDFTDEGIMYFRSELIGRAKYVDKSKGLLFISEETHRKLKRSQIKSGDLLFSMAGAYLGKLSLVSDDDVPANTNQAVAIIRFIPNSCSREYVYYFMLQKWYNEYICSFNAQAAQPNINLEQIGKLKLNMPDRGIQDKIASILSTYDSLIEVNNKRIKLLEQMAENLYKEWFVRFRFPGHESAEFENGLPKGWALSTECKPIIPKGWHYGEFGELGKFVRGKNITSAEMIEGETPVISAGLEPSGFHNEANVHGRSLTISASGANAGYMKYNLDDIWAADCSYYQSENYLWFAYSTLKFLQPVISNLQCGAAQPHVHPKQINRLTVIIPTDKMIRMYCDIVEPMFCEIKSLAKQNENLTKSRDLLLPRLMSGKLEV